MPRNIRPAYLTARCSGRESTVSIGPRARDGTLHASVTLRDRWNVVPALDIRADGYASTDRIDLDTTIRWPATLRLPDGTDVAVPVGSVLQMRGSR